MLFFCFMRIYLLMRSLMVLTEFMSPRSQRICAMNGCEATTMFAIKSLMKKMPYTLLATLMSISTAVFGFQLRMFERKLSLVSKQNFDSIWNSFWNVIITLTTVGYGDFYPKTIMGRLVGVVICIWGVFIVSFFVVNLNFLIDFNNNEQKAYVMHQKLHYKQVLKKKAIDVLASAYQKRNVAIKEPDNQNA